MENCFHRALENAGFTVNAFLRVNIDHVSVFVETLTGTNGYWKHRE